VAKSEAKEFGLLYNPTLEHEVVILFGLLMPHLAKRGESYLIDRYPDTFPDSTALRNKEKVEAEFEVYASDFYDHKHDKDDNLPKCKLLICWNNDIQNSTTRGNKEFFVVKGHEIEIFALDKEVKRLEKEKGLRLIKNGDRPNLNQANENLFFKELQQNRQSRYGLIKDLYNYVRENPDFEIKWGRGVRWLTMRIYVRNWKGVNPIIFRADGYTEIGYQNNKSLPQWWELPQETKAELRKIFKRKNAWHGVRFDSETDFDNMRKALKILAEHSKNLNVIWNTNPSITRRD